MADVRTTKSELIEHLMTGLRCDLWTGHSGDILRVDRETFIKIVYNHCYKAYGMEEEIAKLVDDDRLHSVWLNNSDPKYDIVVAIKRPED